MTLSMSCSVSLVPRAPHSKSFAPTTTNTFSFSVKENTGSWRSRCALGLASLILALGSGDFFVAGGETQAIESPPEVVDSRRVKSSRWSEKRKCPAWRGNSLEIIVPENLPRPSQRRNWNTVTVSEDIQNAPAIQVNTITTNSNSNSRYCYSL